MMAVYGIFILKKNHKLNKNTKISMESNVNLSKNLKQLEVEYKYGVKIRMDRGQRIIDRPTDLNDLQNFRKGTEIYMTSLPRNALEDVLFPLFSTVGRIRQMRIMMEFSGISRGYGFVRYYDRKSADLAVSKLHKSKMFGSTIWVHRSYNNCKLQLSGIPKHISMQNLVRKIDQMFTGVISINKCYPETVPYSVNALFTSHRHALEARKLYWPDKLIISGKKISVEWAKPEEKKSGFEKFAKLNSFK